MLHRSITLTWIALALCVSFALPAQTTEDQKLIPSSGQTLAAFGRSIAIHDNLAVIGADADLDQGAAFVFEFDGAQWYEVQKLNAVTPMPGDRFGASVAIGDGYLAIGAPWDDDNAFNSGSVSIFRHNGIEWVFDAILYNSQPADWDEFGEVVDTADDLLVVSARKDDDQGNDSGSVTCLRDTPTGWIVEQKLVPTIAEANDSFGWNVATDGTVLVMTSVEDDNGTGSAVVYRLDVATWNEETVLTASDGQPLDWFGWGLDVREDVIVVGANHDHAPLDDSGSAYVFRWDGASWLEEQKIRPSTILEFAAFGWSAAIRDEEVVIGAPGYELGEGAVFRYTYNGTTWDETGFWKASDPGAGFDDDLGFSVAFEGPHILSGANWANGVSADSGAAYYFQVPYSVAEFQRGDFNADGTIDVADAVASLAALFIPGAPATECEDAADTNDDSAIDISDAVSLLAHLFIPGSPSPPAPNGTCGEDPTDDPLDCDTFAACP